MNEIFIKNSDFSKAVRKADISAAMYHPNYVESDGKKIKVIIFILNNGEKAILNCESEQQAIDIIKDL